MRSQKTAEEAPTSLFAADTWCVLVACDIVYGVCGVAFPTTSGHSEGRWSEVDIFASTTQMFDVFKVCFNIPGTLWRHIQASQISICIAQRL